MNNTRIKTIIVLLCFILSGCKESKAVEATQISESYFQSFIDKYKVTLNSYDSALNEVKRNDENIGSDNYDTLLKEINGVYEYKSSKKTSIGYTSKGNETIEYKRGISIADQTPEIYTYAGNYHYETGKCSNVVGIQAKSTGSLIIRNCIFENMSGISLYNCHDVTIENCYFKGTENGIYMAKCTNIEIKNCTFDMNTTGLTDYYQGVYLGDGNNDVNVNNCYFNADNDIKKPYRIGSKSTEESPSENITFKNCLSTGHFRSGFQNIDGEAKLENCSFFFKHDKGSYNNAIIIDQGSDKIYTTLSKCSFYLSYRKKLTSSETTIFNDCTYNLYSN